MCVFTSVYLCIYKCVYIYFSCVFLYIYMFIWVYIYIYMQSILERISVGASKVNSVVMIYNLMTLHYIFITLTVIWGCRIHRLLLCRRVRSPPNECPECDTKQSDVQVPVMLVPWRMRNTSSLASFPDPLWPGVVAPDRVQSIGQIELNCILMLSWIAWNRTVLTFKLLTLR